ncbi:MULTISPECIES: dermonecrotic toxin domain-containing protein [Pseudomonas fluorescens group]|uniref:Dermonecrotic toxin N-terminal domain-containing protein n=1 Tax=Pseudomonas fluorescens TaxID=294 RepID=A0A0D0TIT8_PSEFL|nr:MULTISPECIES: DUF6543 domain-containing protein [Pseudomonas fluorescens group]AZE59545.1 hypothetical protein C4K02_1167 [Pseudomonas synxantha]KIR20700.1 hypothetical protein PFLU3_38450 [Pseudomonas fluorescens]
MPALPPPTHEELLRQLSLCTSSLQSLLDCQPLFATQLSAALRQELGELSPDQPLNPDALYLNEYTYDSPSQVPRITRSRNLTQVVQAAVVTGAAPTMLAKATPAAPDGPAMGFYHDALSAGKDGEFATLEVAALNALVDDLRQNSLLAYQRRLQDFWSGLHPLTGGLSVQDAVSQQLRDLLRIEADLKLLSARQAKHPDLMLLTEGRQLIENLILHETLGAATPPRAVSLTLHDPQTPTWSVPLNGVFILSEQLHSTLPAVLYTPQYGGETFKDFFTLQNTLSRRLVSGTSKSLLLANVPGSERERASEVLKSGQNLRFTPINGPVFSHCLHAQRDQQQADIAHAFGTTHATFEALATRLHAHLALPLSGNQALLEHLPAARDPVAQIITPHTAPDSEQQKHLIRLWDSLNEQIGYLLEKDKHPALEGVLSTLLEETFTQLPTDARLDALYVNRYRIDSAGTRRLELSQTLREALLRHLPTDTVQDDTADATLAQAVFPSPSRVAETEQVAWNGTLQELAETLRRRLPAQVTAYWHSPLGPGLSCPQIKLNDLYRQCLDVQARLRFIDTTLSPAAKLLIERVLGHTNQARRETRFSHGQRPGVYQLTVDNGSAQGQRLAGCFVVTPSDASLATLPHWPNGHKNLSTQGTAGSTVHGPVVLFSPVQGLEEFATLQALHDGLTARLDAGEEAGRLLACTLPIAQAQSLEGLWGMHLSKVFRPIEGDFIADAVQSLLDKQLDDIQTLLGQAEHWQEADFKPGCGPGSAEHNGRAELAELLDTASAFMARNQLLLDEHRPDWEKRLSPTNKARLHSHAQAALEKQQVLAQQWKVVPALSEYAKQQVMAKINALPAMKALAASLKAGCPVPEADPDLTMVTRTERVRISAGSGFGSGHESVGDVERMSLTQLLLRNTKPWEKSLTWSADDKLETTLTNTAGRWLRDGRGKPITLAKDVLEQWLKELNIGPRYIENVLQQHLYPQPMTRQDQALKDTWMAAQQATLSYAALLAELNPDAYSTPLASDNAQKKGAAWVAAVLAAPAAQNRQPVDGQSVIAAALMFNPASDAPEGRGGQTVNGVLLIGTAVDEPVVMYTPDAPDGQLLREVQNEAELARLTQAPAWQTYLKARLPTDARLLNPRFAPHTGDFLAGLYRQHQQHLTYRADEQTLSNEELESQSTFNKVMYGLEFALTALGAFPGVGHYAASTVKWLARVGGLTLQTLRKLGRNIPGLIVRHGFAGRVMVEMANAGAPVAGAARSAGISLRPLPLVLGSSPRGTRSMSQAILPGYQREFQRQSASLAVPGGIPTSASLAEGSAIYRTAGSPSTLLVRGTHASGDEVVLRIQDSFNLYDPDGVVARVLTPSGASTPFRLRRMAGTQRWALDTLERLPGGAPKTSQEVDEALRQWQVYVATTLAQAPGQAPVLTPAVFFAERGIPFSTWSQHVRQSGELTARGIERLTFEAKPFNDATFMRWVDAPNKTPQSAQLFRQENSVKLSVWEAYVQPDGALTIRGLARQSKILNTRITGKANRRITDQHLKAWYEKSRDPANRNRIALERFAIENDIHLASWYRYVRFDGSFKEDAFLVRRLKRLNIPVAEVSEPLPGPSTEPV